MTYTFLWHEAEEVQRALHKRNFAYTIDARGLTVDWYDTSLSVETLSKGIREWVKQDSTQSRFKRSVRRKRV